MSKSGLAGPLTHPCQIACFVFTSFNKKIRVFISIHVKTHTVHTVHNCVRELFTILFYMSLSKVTLSKIKDICIYVKYITYIHMFYISLSKVTLSKIKEICIHVKHIIYICFTYPSQKFPV